MTRTLRISNIAPTTTADALASYFRDKGLQLSTGNGKHGIYLVKAEDDNIHATVSFYSDLVCKRALALSYEDRKLDNRLLVLSSNFDGFTVLSEGSQVDIIALHGLNGHAFDSWEFYNRKGYNFMWLRDYLPERFPSARVMVYGYTANAISELGTEQIRSQAAERPLLLVGHSMGGLVIKQALIIAKDNNRYQTILNSVHGVLSLGTPHQGGKGVDNARFVANFLRPFNRNVRMDLIKGLRPDSMILFDLTNEFRKLVEARRIKIATLIESKSTRIGFFRHVRVHSSFYRFLSTLSDTSVCIFQIVDEASAALGVSVERKASINANHINMCKFRNPSDKSLAVAVQVIKDLRGEILPMTTPTLLPHHEFNAPRVQERDPSFMLGSSGIP
ncbi:hypothetical protein SCHPADRAFT_837791 [Schizopora paradoxa]|uniref:GPI inositol-deacylase n=1 Tax=Schizopora paradoxa TaxID=27342 RepID=A0A0H2R5M0_9AGAM|nr:hypothetical protein SCHPADRAFT_837791 [Schizopora paradoxa]